MALMIAEILISLLAVFGLYAAVRLLCAAFFSPKEVIRAIQIDRVLTEDEAAWLVWRAREGVFDARRRIVALVPERLARIGGLVDTFTALGVECYLIEEEKGG